MPFRATLEECDVLNPYPELNPRGTFRATTQGTPASWPLRYPRSAVNHVHQSKHNTNLLQQNRLALPTRRQALPASKPPGGGRIPSGAKRLLPYYLYNYHLVEHPSPLGASHHIELLEQWLSLDRLNSAARRHTSTSNSSGFSALHSHAPLSHVISHLHCILSTNSCLITNVLTPILTNSCLIY